MGDLFKKKKGGKKEEGLDESCKSHSKQTNRIPVEKLCSWQLKAPQLASCTAPRWRAAPRRSVYFCQSQLGAKQKHNFHREKVSTALFFPSSLLLMPKWYQSSNSVSTALSYWLSASVTLKVIFQRTLSLCCHSGRNADWLHTTEWKCFRQEVFKIH